MAHKNINDRTLKALKAARKGEVVDYWDKGFPGFGVRVSDTGERLLCLPLAIRDRQVRLDVSSVCMGR